MDTIYNKNILRYNAESFRTTIGVYIGNDTFCNESYIEFIRDCIRQENHNELVKQADHLMDYLTADNASQLLLNLEGSYELIKELEEYLHGVCTINQFKELDSMQKLDSKVTELITKLLVLPRLAEVINANQSSNK